jgi:hypothetical protein
MPRDGFVTREHADGKARAREVFSQPIHVLLADHRAVKICVHKAGVGRWESDDKFYEWINANISEYFETFPSWPAELKRETVEHAIAHLEHMSVSLDNIGAMGGRRRLRGRITELAEQARGYVKHLRDNLDI